MKCNYKCKKCDFSWQGYRVVPVKNTSYDVLQYIREKGPGMTICPRCKHEYIAWTNHERFAEWLRKNKD